MYINAVCGTGSTGKIVADLAEVLRSRGHEAKVAFGVGDAVGVPESDAIRIGGMANYYIHNALSRFTDHAGLYSKEATRRLIDFASEYNPDIYHIHNLHGYYVNYEMLFEYLAKADKPVVMTLHDCWNFTGHCTHFCQLNCNQWKTCCRECGLLYRYPVCYLSGDVEMNYSRKKAAFSSIRNMTVVAPSDWLGSLAKESFLGEYSVEVIPNGVDTDIFRPTEGAFREAHSVGDDTMVLGVSNVWNESKGFCDFLRLSQMLGEGYRVVLVGVSDNQIRSMPDDVIGVTRTNDLRSLAEIYSAADLFVNLTREDTSSMVNLEAQACGTPVITYDAGGCAETIIEGFGISLPCGDLASVERLIKDKGRNFFYPGKEEITKRVDKARSHEMYLSLYRRMMKAPSLLR